MKKKIILLTIILIPSLIYFFFELSEVNFKKMAYYGPKKVNNKGDSIYYSVPDSSLLFGEVFSQVITDSSDYKNQATINNLLKTEKSFIILFIDKNQESKLSGLLEFEKYKKEKLDFLQIFIIQQPDSFPLIQDSLYYKNYLKKNLGINSLNFQFCTYNVNQNQYNNIRATYFKQKPVHVFNYFAVLVDKNKNIRGYYDPTYISEVKRMIEEYKHLVLKEEHLDMQQINKIEKQ